MKTNATDLAETRTARDAWDRIGQVNELLPSEQFRDELAPAEAYYDHSSDWPTPEPRRTGPESTALRDVVHGCCCGWAEHPSASELYNAFRAEHPTERQLALLRTWLIEASIGQILEGWAQQAYTDRELVRAIHRIGCSRTDVPKIARRIRLINSWAMR